MPPPSRWFRVCLLVAVVVAARPVKAAPGDLDPSFDGDGVVKNASESEASAVVIQADGKILAALGGDFGVVRYESDGTLDTGFGSSGRATADFGVGGQVSTAALIAPDGKIVVSGVAPPDSVSSQLAIARFDANGVLDPTFGTGGKTLTGVPVDVSDFTRTMVRLSSGRLVIGGSASFMGGTHGVLVAYDDTGVLDPGFGTGGVVLTTEPSSINAIAVSAGEIVAVGSTSDGHLALARFASDGTAGTVTMLPAAAAFASGIGIDPTGRIVVASATIDCNDTLVARFVADGTLDPDFGTDGVAVIDVVTPTTAACGDFAKALALQPDGRILVASEGQTYDAPPSPLTLSTWWLLRLDPDGALDLGFGDDGVVFIKDRAAPNALAMQGDGKVVTGGYTETAVYDPPFAIYLETSLALTRNEAMATPVCSAAPRSSCGPAGAHSSTLKLSRRNGKTPTLHWSWKKGTSTGADFGDPTTGGSYALCVYDGSDALVGTAQVEGGGICNGKPCWKTTGTSGWQYKNQRGTVFGIDKVKLKTASGKAALDFQGKHANLPVVPLPATLPVRVQMQTSTGSCFEAVYSSASRNDATSLAAKN